MRLWGFVEQALDGKLEPVLVSLLPTVSLKKPLKSFEIHLPGAISHKIVVMFSEITGASINISY